MKRTWSIHLLALLGYTLLAVAITWPLVTEFASALPGEGTDAWQYLWNFWWFDQALFEGQPLYWTPAQYYPGTSLLFHTLSPLHSVLGLPVRLLAGPTSPDHYIATYNWVVLLSTVLSGYGVYLLAREVIGGRGGHHARRAGPINKEDSERRLSRPEAGSKPAGGYLQRREKEPIGVAGEAAAFLAGAIFALAPYRSVHLLGHLSLVATETIPLFALFCWRALRRPSPRAAGLAKPALGIALSWLAAALIDWYYPLYMGLLAGFFILWALGEALLRRRSWPQAGRTAAAIAGGLLAAVLLLSPLLVPMLREARSAAAYLEEPLEFSTTYGADLLAWFLPSPLHPLWGDVFHRWTDGFAAGNTAEGIVYLGFIPLVLAVMGLWRSRRRGKLWVAMGGLFGLLALGPSLKVLNHRTGIPLPYRLLAGLPIVRFTRVPSRYAVLTQLAVALLAGLGLAGLLRRPRFLHIGRKRGRSRRWPAWLSVTLLLALVMLEYAAMPYPLTPAEVPPFYKKLAGDPAHYALLEVPLQEPNRQWYYTEWMLHQTVHQKWSFRGYLSRGDPLFPFEGTPVFRQFARLAPFGDILYDDYSRPATSVLSHYRVGYVVLERARLEERNRLADAQEIVREVLGPVEPAYEGEKLIAYPVDWGRVEPFLRLGEGWHEVEAQAWGPFRWIERDRADLFVVLPEDGAGPGETITLTFQAVSFLKPRRLEMWLGEEMVAAVEVGTALERYRIDLALPAGETRLAWRTEGYDVPARVGVGEDPRPISIGVSELRIGRP